MANKEEETKKKFEAFEKFEKAEKKAKKQQRDFETSSFEEYRKHAKEKAKLDNEQLQNNEDSRNLAKEIHEIHKKKLDTLNSISKANKEIVDLEESILKALGMTAEELLLISDIEKDNFKALLNQRKEEIKQAKLLKKNLQIKLEIQEIEEKALPHLKQLTQATRKLNKEHTKYLRSVESSLDFVDGIDDALNSIPIVGGILSAALGLDDIKEKLAKSLINAFNPVENLQKKQSEQALNGYSNQIDRLNEVEGAASNVTTEMGGIAPTLAAGAGGAAALETGLIGSAGAATGLMAALGPLGWIALAIGAIVAAFQAFKKLAYEIDSTQVSIAKNMAITKEQAIKLHKTLNDQNVLFKEQVTITAYLAKEYGAFSDALAGDIPRLRALQHNLQLSDESMAGISVAANVLGVSMKGTTKEASDFEMIVVNSTKELYNQAGINVDNAQVIVDTKQTLEDIGSISRINLALYGKSGKALSEQVFIVRKLGLTFDQVAKTMDSVLDFETSIEAEMKANVLLGTNMNLNAVREASLRGDTAQVAIEINKVMEDQNITLEKFNNMMPFQKKALSASLGMQGDELQMMLLKNKIGDKALIAGIKSGATTKQMLIDKTDLTKEEIAQLVVSERKTGIEQDMAEIQDQLSQTIKANMPGVQAFIGALADFGLEVSDAGGLGGWILGTGRSAKQIKQEQEDKANKVPQTDYSKTTTGYEPGTQRAVGAKLPIIGPLINGIEAVFGSIANKFGPAPVTEADTRTLEEKQAAMFKMFKEKSEGPVKVYNDTLIRPGEDPIGFNKDDIILAGTDKSIDTSLLTSAKPTVENKDTSISGKLGDLMNSVGSSIENLFSAPATPAESSEVVALLKELIKKIEQPVQFNVGGKVIQEIDKVIAMNRSYTSKENGYGT